MRALFLDCGMGAAGDMLTAALLELFPDPDAILEELNAIGIPHVKYSRSDALKCGITGTHVSVQIDGFPEESHPHIHDEERHHSHHSLADIEAIVRALCISDKIQNDILAVYRLIAEAESRVHGRPVSEVHFHEVGALDAIADVTAVCVLMERLAPDQIVASPVHVGSGTVRCAHGILPVPAPATALILEGIPVYGGEISGELCTPTGAALLRHFVHSFGKMPVMRITKIGYGMGTKDFQQANCVRAMLSDSVQNNMDTMLELSVNIDDMTAEQIGFAAERLFEAGAVEVYTIPIGMKKSRPGTLLRAICPIRKRESVVRTFFQHTSTLGVREVDTRRYVLNRHVEEHCTSLGSVHLKRAEGYGVTREKIEYDDLAQIARKHGVSIGTAKSIIEQELDS